MSGVPVREAIKTLTAQGILDATPYLGTRIVALDPINQARVREARAALEKIAARDARQAYAANPKALARLDAAIGKMEREARNNDQLGSSKADIEFHREICRAPGNEIIMTLWEALARLAFIIMAHENLDSELQRYVELQRQLRTAITFGEGHMDERIDRHILHLDYVHVRLLQA